MLQLLSANAECLGVDEIRAVQDDGRAGTLGTAISGSTGIVQVQKRQLQRQNQLQIDQSCWAEKRTDDQYKHKEMEPEREWN